MVRRLCLSIAAAAPAALPGAGPASVAVVHGPPLIPTTGSSGSTVSSTNWSGYATTGATFTDVKGSWVQPSVTCPSTKRRYASFWVGIDGYQSSTVEQIGTDSDCSHGHGVYYAWYELFPAPSQTIGSISVRPGDVIDAEVSSSGSTFTLSIKDTTSGGQFSIQQVVAGAANSSAEWIAEAPSGCGATGCRVLPLADFGTVNFSGSSTTGSGTTGTISDSAWTADEIVMRTSGGTVKAQPSALSSGGSAFSVTWKHS